MSLALKVGIIVLGLVFYFFSISTLLNQRRDIAEQQVLFDSIDYNKDGVLTTQEINGFRPCAQSNNSKLITRLHSIGPSVTFDQFEQDVNKNMIKYAMAPCSTSAHLFANPAEISKRTPANTVQPFFALYDLNRDGSIRYNQYQLVNKFHGRSIKGSTDTFVYLDANNDWELSRAELEKAKLENLDPKLPASARRKATLPRHGHGHGHAAAAAAPAAAATAERTPSPSAQQRAYDRYEEPRQGGYYDDRYDTQRDVYSREPDYNAGPGEYDIIYDDRISASERIERERRLERAAQRERAGYYEPEYQRAGYDERVYIARAQPQREYVERTERPVRGGYAQPSQARQEQRLDATGRLDSLSSPRPRTTVYRDRNYEYGL